MDLLDGPIGADLGSQWTHKEINVVISHHQHLGSRCKFVARI